METHPLVSIIIVSFNTKSLTLSCIESIKKYVKTPYEIILVDNNSSDGTVQSLRNVSKSVHLIKNKENVGFAKANNQGIAVSKGKFILLLNSDTLFLNDALTPCLNFLNSHNGVGILSCKLLNKDKSVQPTGGFFPSPFRIFNWMFGTDDLPIIGSLVTQFHPKPNFYSTDRDLDWVTGAFFLIRDEVIKKVGTLDEDYFMYVEEMDYCYRVKQSGWKVKYLASEGIVHFGGASSSSIFAIENELRNQVLFYKKHKSNIETWIVRLFLKSGSLLRGVLFAILGNEEKYETYFKLARTL